MTTSARGGAPWRDWSLVSRNAEMSRAIFDLEGRYGLILELQDGWARGDVCAIARAEISRPIPEHQWRTTLSRLHLVAGWIETP